MAIAKGWSFAPPQAESGKRVLVVGAGPSGLSAAYHLRRMGHAVEIHEAGPFAGGMMRFGIPKYRLPRDVLDAEIERIVDLGVVLKLNAKVDRIVDSMKAGRFDAAFLAVGAHIGKRAFIPAGSAAKILDAVTHAAFDGRRGQAAARPPRRRLRRRQHGDRCRAHRQAPGRDRGDHRLSPHARPHAGARLRGRGGLAGRHHDEMALDHQAHGRGRAHRREDAARRQGLPAADRRVRDAGSQLAGAGARPGRRSVAARRRARTGDQGRHGAGRRRT